MDIPYPTAPDDVPATLTQPSKAYKQRAWLAGTCLLAFVLTYLFLAGWFVLTAWRLLSDGVASDGGSLTNWLVGGGSAFLAVFMLKGLFFLQRGSNEGLLELKEADQPRLFAFLHRLADEAGAPRPARVYLSARVNAAVFYDLSILNLLFPSRKNLEIGLALVNVLNLSEFKAVLAHEFGHFAQRSMAIGSWVYIAQQIASQIIHRRDALDKLLTGLSSTDFRLAWVGWLLSLVVWSIRSLMDSLLRLVVLAQRALSRQMEFQADLVAVSLSGSDEIVSALHKLQAADESWGRTLGFAQAQLRKGKRVHDIFAVQRAIIAKTARILDDPAYGASATPGKTDRVFKTSFAQAPQMWATHPASADREENAKQHYIASRRDARSAWLLFEQRETITATLTEPLLPLGEATVASAAETGAALNEYYRLRQFSPRYRGAFLGRPLSRHAAVASELYGAALPATGLSASIQALYPKELADDLGKLRDLNEEHLCLKGLQDKVYQAKGGRLVFRGRDISRRELPTAIALVKQESDLLRTRILDHDRLCRSVHLAAAEKLAKGWPEYLHGLIAVLHFAEHSEADLRDAQGFLANVYAVVTADGKVSKSELTRLIEAANTLHGVLQRLYERRGEVCLDSSLLEYLQASSWSEMLGELGLPEANSANIGEWLKVVDGWLNGTANACSSLASACIEQLLLTEDKLAQALNGNTELISAPAASVIYRDYALLLPGQERKRQTTLGWWDRFQTADGLLFTGLRLIGATAIVGIVLGFGAGAASETDVSVYNGLNQAVEVRIGSEKLTLGPRSANQLAVHLDDDSKIVAKTRGGEEIEHFKPELQGHNRHYVYNVAGASPLVQWTASYGNAAEVPVQLLGTPRWFIGTADVYFADAPKSISSKSGGGTRKVLSAPPAEVEIQSLPKLIDNRQEQRRVAALHLRWDTPDARTPIWQEWAK